MLLFVKCDLLNKPDEWKRKPLKSKSSISGGRAGFQTYLVFKVGSLSLELLSHVVPRGPPTTSWQTAFGRDKVKEKCIN